MTKTSLAAKADNDGVIEAPLPQFRTAYSGQLHVRLICDPAEDRTQQSFKDDADINNIMARYLKTGILPEGRGAPQFVDTTAIDFQNAQDLVAHARGQFSLLSAEERDSYGNQVELWLDHQAQLRQEAAQAELDAQAAATAQAAAAAAAAATAGAPGAPATPPAKPGEGG